MKYEKLLHDAVKELRWISVTLFIIMLVLIIEIIIK